MHERSHVLERFQRHNPGNDDRARQRPAPFMVGQNGTLRVLDRKQGHRSLIPLLRIPLTGGGTEPVTAGGTDPALQCCRSCSAATEDLGSLTHDGGDSLGRRRNGIDLPCACARIERHRLKFASHVA